MNRQKVLEKNIRTLEMEKGTRDKEIELKKKMKMLKDERPTFGNKFRKASLQITKAGLSKAIAISKPKVSSKRRKPSKKRVVRRKRTVKRKSTERRKVRRRY